MTKSSYIFSSSDPQKDHQFWWSVRRTNFNDPLVRSGKVVEVHFDGFLGKYPVVAKVSSWVLMPGFKNHRLVSEQVAR